MIKRKLFKSLKEHLNEKEISLIIGPRQVGKTTLMLMLKEHIEKNGQNSVYLNLDIETDKQFITSQSALIQKIQLELPKNSGVVFIDEIQRKEDAGIFLKGIYDMNLPYKFVVSGSGSVELKEKIHESLVGRKRIFQLNPVSFEEFVNFKTEYRYENRLIDFLSIEKEKTQHFLNEYLNFGGYPRVVLAETIKEKREVINEIYQSYIEKDISYLLGVKKTSAFTDLVKLMAAQCGNLVNLSELSSTLGISVKTVKDYLWYLEKTFVLQKVTPFYRNIRKEISKMPIFYFTDLGLRNYALNSLGNLNPQDIGFVFQNLVLNILQETTQSSSSEIHFWRTKSGAEVDFVVDSGQEVTPYEIKYSAVTKPHATRSFLSFLAKYKPQKAYVVNLTLQREQPINGTRVFFIPFYELYSPK